MRPVLITGGSGTLGRAFARLCDERGLAHRLTDRATLDIADPGAIERALEACRPWLVINAAGHGRIDDAEADQARCWRDNVLGPARVARACARTETALVTFSSDLVFDGGSDVPYVESDRPAPLGVFGLTKHEAEQRVLDAHPAALVIRMGACFGPWDDHNFVTAALRELAAGHEARVADDVTVSPAYVPDLGHACLDLAIDGERGRWHLAHTGAVTLVELARRAANGKGLAHDRVVAVHPDELGWRARRPRYRALGTTRGALLPGLDDALHRYHQARHHA